ncbi:universal stress protein [Agromyces soli]|uniref:Universal stress protein n=1 Tax=Agromyces soli TaxID=659012 RepID=A0ABY4AUF4_9MICO|nr:universal stress protein [Agromyces soli]UOE26799.1 universal stress protein [Agromyces soli]
MFERIVVGIDGSPAAQHAADWAARIAGDGHLVLVHVERDRETGSDYLSATSKRAGDRVTLIDEGERIRAANPGLHVVTSTETGPVVDVLRTFLRRGTLVVVGRDADRGGRWSAGVRLAGSHSAGAVAVVPSGEGGADDLGVVVGVDGSVLGREAIRVGADLATALQLRLTLLHAWAAPAFWESDLAEYASEFAEFEQMHRDTLAAAMDSGTASGAEPHARLVHGRPADELLEAVDTARAIVVGSHSGSAVERFLLGSVSHEVLLRSPIPVVVVLPG